MQLIFRLQKENEKFLDLLNTNQQQSSNNGIYNLVAYLEAVCPSGP
jgi:hypothetical protein